MAETQTATSTNLTGISRVAVTVSNQDKAIAFYVDTLGFEKLCDIPYGNGERWIEVAAAGSPTPIALVLPREGGRPPGGDSGVIFHSNDIDASYAALKARGADVDAEVARWGGPVPPMFQMRDQDGNSLVVVGDM